jgi:hypothetical protein
MTAGEFSAIVAVSKAKNHFKTISSRCLYRRGCKLCYLVNIQSHRKEETPILDFDTEQGGTTPKEPCRRVEEISNRNYP